MAYDEPADLIGSCEATLDTLGLLIGDMSEEVQERGRAWTIAQSADRRGFVSHAAASAVEAKEAPSSGARASVDA